MSFLGRMISSVSEFYKDINPATLTGAIDVIVVEDLNGNFACSPFHVRFGKFKVFKTQDKTVLIHVNDKSVPIMMKIGEAGEAFFVNETTDDVPKEYQTSPLLNPMDSTVNEMQKLSLSPILPRSLESAVSDSELFEGSIKNHILPPSNSETASHLSDSEVFYGKDDMKSTLSSLSAGNVGPNWDWEWGDIPHKESTRSQSLDQSALSSPTFPSTYATPMVSNHVHNIYMPFIQIILDKENFAKSLTYFQDHIQSLIEGKGRFSSCALLPVKENTSEELNRVFCSATNILSKQEDSYQKLSSDKNIITCLDDSNYLPVNVVFNLIADFMFGKKLYSVEEVHQILVDTIKKFSADFVNINNVHVVRPSSTQSKAFSSPERFSNRLKRWFKPSTSVEIVSTEPEGNSPLRLSTNVIFKSKEPGNSPPPSPISYIKSLRLTSNQLKALELKAGINYVRFSLATNQTASCSARIFLWKHSTKIIISDIDGTITKSDALGHIFTLVGKDWTHAGVANLYTLIHKNGYQFMYLTSRAIGQATSTRDYLLGIDQNSFQLPVGPVIMSPDRLFAAFHREIILKKPEEFKIIVLKDISRLFKKIKSPFFAGFGNRITDVVSYKAVDIPSSKIFIVNSDGDVSLNNLSIFFTTSYSKLIALVDKIFPPLTSDSMEEDESEEFNDFCYWRPSIPDISMIEERLAVNDRDKKSFDYESTDRIDIYQEDFPFI